MGKKRRMRSAKAKFKAKHSAHPRMQLLAAPNTNVVAEEVIESPVEVEVAVAPVEVMVAAPPVIPQEEEAIVPPEIIAKSKRSRKRKTKTTKSTRKNTGA
jgi:hypothetical protein